MKIKHLLYKASAEKQQKKDLKEFDKEYFKALAELENKPGYISEWEKELKEGEPKNGFIKR